MTLDRMVRMTLGALGIGAALLAGNISCDCGQDKPKQDSSQAENGVYHPDKRMNHEQEQTHASQTAQKTEYEEVVEKSAVLERRGFTRLAYADYNTVFVVPLDDITARAHVQKYDMPHFVEEVIGVTDSTITYIPGYAPEFSNLPQVVEFDIATKQTKGLVDYSTQESTWTSGRRFSEGYSVTHDGKKKTAVKIDADYFELHDGRLDKLDGGIPQSWNINPYAAPVDDSGIEFMSFNGRMYITMPWRHDEMKDLGPGWSPLLLK